MKDRIYFTIRDFLSAEECQEAIARAEEIGFEAAPITTSRGFVMAPDVRNNTRVMIDDVALASTLWQRLRPLIAPRAAWQPIGLNERLRFYRYDVGQAFRWHHDGAFIRNAAERSFLTFIIYLNNVTRGGATELDLPGASITPETGAALVFDHGILHQGAPVQEGRKYVLRSDVMFRKT